MPNDQVLGKLSFNTPSWRVVRVMFKDLESELRKRNRDYDLVAMTQAGDLYTCVFKAKEPMRGRERILRETHETETQPEEKSI